MKHTTIIHYPMQLWLVYRYPGIPILGYQNQYTLQYPSVCNGGINSSWRNHTIAPWPPIVALADPDSSQSPALEGPCGACNSSFTSELRCGEAPTFLSDHCHILLEESNSLMVKPRISLNASVACQFSDIIYTISFLVNHPSLLFIIFPYQIRNPSQFICRSTIQR